MSTSLTIRWIFGYLDPTGKSFGLENDHYGDCVVEAAECMGGSKDTLVYAKASEVIHLNDRNGYDYKKPVFSFSDLPPTADFAKALKRLLAKVPLQDRPKSKPQWFLHTDMG